MRRASLGVMTAMIVATSCTGGFCTSVGCATGVSVDLPKGFPVSALPIDVTICADNVCNTTNIDPTSTSGQTPVPVFAQLALDDKGERDVAVRLEVRSTSSATVLVAASGTGRLKRDQPNGKGCEPVCYSASFTYDEASNTLTQR